MIIRRTLAAAKSHTPECRYEWIEELRVGDVRGGIPSEGDVFSAPYMWVASPICSMEDSGGDI